MKKAEGVLLCFLGVGPPLLHYHAHLLLGRPPTQIIKQINTAPTPLRSPVTAFWWAKNEEQLNRPGNNQHELLSPATGRAPAAGT